MILYFNITCSLACFIMFSTLEVIKQPCAKKDASLQMSLMSSPMHQCKGGHVTIILMSWWSFFQSGADFKQEGRKSPNEKWG